MPFAPTLTLACPVSSTGTLGISYTGRLIADGGVEPYTFAITVGVLPPGLSLNTDGVIVGVPTTVGTYPYTAQITDHYGTTATISCSITISRQSLFPFRKLLNILTSKQWATIKESVVQGVLSTDVYIDQNFPNLGLHFWPMPSGSPTIQVHYWLPLRSFTSVDETIDLPPAYYEALKYALAVYISRSYQNPVNPAIVALADMKKSAMQTLNAQILAGSFTPDRTLHNAEIGDPLQPRAAKNPQGTGPGDKP